MYESIFNKFGLDVSPSRLGGLVATHSNGYKVAVTADGEWTIYRKSSDPTYEGTSEIGLYDKLLKVFGAPKTESAVGVVDLMLDGKPITAKSYCEAEPDVKLTDPQIVTAAKMFTVVNLGGPSGPFKDKAAVDIAYREVQMAHEAEGIDIVDEYLDWKKRLTKGDKWSVSEAKKKLPWLINV